MSSKLSVSSFAPPVTSRRLTVTSQFLLLMLQLTALLAAESQRGIRARQSSRKFPPKNTQVDGMEGSEPLQLRLASRIREHSTIMVHDWRRLLQTRSRLPTSIGHSRLHVPDAYGPCWANPRKSVNCGSVTASATTYGKRLISLESHRSQQQTQCIVLLKGWKTTDSFPVCVPTIDH